MTGKTRRREVRCTKCGSWWHNPKEPVHFGSWDEWADEHPGKEALVCPNCGEVTEVSGETARFTKVSPETSAPPGVSKETPGFTKTGKPKGPKPGKKGG
jgi:rRNA maturation protein Nop10